MVRKGHAPVCSKCNDTDKDIPGFSWDKGRRNGSSELGLSLKIEIVTGKNIW